MKSEFRAWSDIRVFLAVMRAGSTLAASRVLSMSQPTVARRIEALEHETGLTLFTRDTRGFRPTDAAKTLLSHAEAIEAAARAFGNAALALTAPRPIRITAFNANFSVRASDIFSAFSSLHPEVQFDFLPTVKTLDLMAGEADIALRLTRSAPDPDLVCRKISTAQFALFGSPAYRDRHGMPRGLDDLAGHRFITFRRRDVPARIDDWLTSMVSPDQITLTCAEIDVMHAAIRAGQGLGVVNLKMAESDGGFIRCSDPIDALTSQHLMLIGPEAWRRPEVRTFTRFFAPRYAAIYR